MPVVAQPMTSIAARSCTEQHEHGGRCVPRIVQPGVTNARIFEQLFHS
ncbi:hypothetical protein [Actinoplanes sp. NPDC049599]